MRLLRTAALGAALLVTGPALAAELHFFAIANSAQEVPEPDTDALGRVDAVYDRGLSSLDVRLRLRGIESAILAGHFHCARAGVNGPIAFGLMNPGPLTEIGEVTRVVLTNADSVDVTGDPERGCTASIGRELVNVASLLQAMQDGLIYLNIHTADHPAGQVRGQLLELDD